MHPLDSVFGALADPTRRRILQGLARGSAAVGTIAKPFPLSAPAVSRHLRVLEKAGLIRREKHGRIHEIALEAKPLRSAADWLDAYRRHWEASLDALAHYLEAEASDPFQEPKKSQKTKSAHPRK